MKKTNETKYKYAYLKWEKDERVYIIVHAVGYGNDSLCSFICIYKYRTIRTLKTSPFTLYASLPLLSLIEKLSANIDHASLLNMKFLNHDVDLIFDILLNI